ASLHHAAGVRRFMALAALSMAAFGAAPASAQNAGFTFGLWGDMPYAKAGDTPKMPALIADMNGSDIAFSLYDGDLKAGSSKCTDDVYDAARKMFDQFNKPVVYIPGDNEWTDCHRLNNGGYDNLERLDYIRKVMFTKNNYGTGSLPLERQGKAGEKFLGDGRFLYRGLTFVGLNGPRRNNKPPLPEEGCTPKNAPPGRPRGARNVEDAP